MWVDIPKKKKGPGKWDPKKRMELVQSYVLLGNLRQSAALNNVPEITVRVWKTTQWWKDMEDELRRSTKLKLSSKLQQVIDKALLVLEDRLDNGDFYYNKVLGTWDRREVSADTAIKAVSQLVDRNLKVEAAATTERVTDEGLDARLTKLRNEMVSFAKTGKLTNESILLEIKDADYSVVAEVEVEAKPHSVQSDISASSGEAQTAVPSDLPKIEEI